MYSVFFPPGVTVTTTSGGFSVFFPYTTLAGSGCSGYGSGDLLKTYSALFSHELLETMTDPFLNNWYTASGFEIGDLCTYGYYSPPLVKTLTINGKNYNVQKEWSNSRCACY